MKTFRDGDQLCVVGEDFVNLQESPASFIPLHRAAWLVGQWVDKTWELAGVFEIETEARAARRDETYFIAEILLNSQAPHETTPFPKGVEYGKDCR